MALTGKIAGQRPGRDRTQAPPAPVTIRGMATSVVVAAQSLYASLSASLFPGNSRPPMYFDRAPEITAAGAQLRPPYVVLVDPTGRTPEYLSNDGGTETGDLTLEVFAGELADVDQIVAAIKFGGSGPSTRAGFDWATLTLTAPYYHVSLRRTNERRYLVSQDKDGKRVHGCTITYEVTTGLSPTLA